MSTLQVFYSIYNRSFLCSLRLFVGLRDVLLEIVDSYVGTAYVESGFEGETTANPKWCNLSPAGQPH